MEKYTWTNTEYPENESDFVLLWVYDSEVKIGYPWIDLASFSFNNWVDFDGKPIETDILKVKCWMFLDKEKEDSEYPETI